jgi:2-dehydro-3-deoxygluconokinase
MSEIVCFGEVMLRLTTPHFSTLADAPSLDLAFGGAEANAAVQLAQFGRSAAFVSRLPENGLGDRCIADLRGRGVDTGAVWTRARCCAAVRASACIFWSPASGSVRGA